MASMLGSLRDEIQMNRRVARLNEIYDALSPLPGAEVTADLVREMTGHWAQDEDPQVRTLVGKILLRIDSPEGKPTLKRLLTKDTDDTVRKAIVVALGKSQSAGRVDLLRSVLLDKSETLVVSAAEVLARLEARDAAADVAKAACRLVDRRHHVVKPLEALWGDEAADALIEALNHPDPRITAQAEDLVTLLSPKARESIERRDAPGKQRPPEDKEPSVVRVGQLPWMDPQPAPGHPFDFELALDPADNVFMTGSLRGTVRLGERTLYGSDQAVYVAKLDRDARLLWLAASPETPGRGCGNGLAVDPAGDLLVTGWFVGQPRFGSTKLWAMKVPDIFIAKLNPQGEFLWVVQSGGKEGRPAAGDDVTVDASGNVFVIGASSGGLRLGPFELTGAGREIFVAKLDPAGKFLWAVRTEGLFGSAARAIAVDPAGHVLIAGEVRSKNRFGAPSIDVTKRDVFVAKLDPAGKFLWVTQGGGADHDRAHRMSLDWQGNVLVAGTFEGTATFGATTLSTAESERDAPPDDTDTFGATSPGHRQPESDLFLAKLDPGGSFLWAVRAGGAGNESIRDLALDSQGNLLVTGTFQGTATFGDDALSERWGSLDDRERMGTSGPMPPPEKIERGFVAKISPDGEFLWVVRVGEGTAIGVDSDDRPVIVDRGFLAKILAPSESEHAPAEPAP